MPSNFNGSPIAAIPHSALKIRALCFIPDRQSIKVSQTIQAESLAWPALTTDMLSYSGSSPWAYIWAGMEVMPRLSGSPPSQQILEYTTQAKQGRGPLRSPLVLHSLGITFGKHQRGAGRIPPHQLSRSFGGFCGVRHAPSRHTPLACSRSETHGIIQCFLKSFCDCDIEKKIIKIRMKGRLLESVESLRRHLCTGELPAHRLGTVVCNLRLPQAQPLRICAAPPVS